MLSSETMKMSTAEELFPIAQSIHEFFQQKY